MRPGHPPHRLGGWPKTTAHATRATVGGDVVPVEVKKGKGTYGYNAATGEYGDMLDMGGMGGMGM